MKKLFCLILALMLLMMAGCAAAERTVAENDAYAVIEYNGIYTLRFREPLPSNKNNSGANGQLTGGEPITFRSVAEMKAAIEGGTFTEKQIETIRKYFKRSGNEILSLNTNKLYELVLPEGMEYQCVDWYGFSYVFQNCTDGKFSGYIDFETKEEHETSKEKMMDFLEINKDVTQYQAEDRNATIYEYVSPFDIPIRIYAYTIESEGKIITVHEVCRLSGKTESLSSFKICGEQDGGYFYGQFRGNSRPTVEWLQSFGLTPYTQTAVK